MTSPGENQPRLSFATAAGWEAWLKKNHHKSKGVWLRIFKKSSGEKTVTYDEALDGALCYGWIDGSKKSYDAVSWIQKFTPRRAKSLWSKRNIEHIERLLRDHRIQPAGLAAIEAAKSDGRWQAAYDSPSKAAIPEDFLTELNRSKKAKMFFNTLNKTDVYAITWRLQTAKKPETRRRRLEAILAMLAKGEKFHG